MLRIRLVIFLVVLCTNIFSLQAGEIGGIQLTPLMDAVNEKDLNKVVKLLDKGVNPNEKVDRGLTALWLAVASSNVEAVRVLLERGATQKIYNDISPLSVAVRLEDNLVSTQIASLLIEHGLPAGHINENGMMPDLVTAIFHKNTALVKLLIDNGASVNTASEKGRSPLNLAVSTGQYDVVQLLIGAGAQANNESLTLAYALVDPTILKLVIENGIDPNTYVPVGEYKESLIQVAFNTNNAESIKVLVENGIDVNAVTRKGTAPLVFASQMGHVDLARFMLKKGADISMKDHAGNDALFYAEKNGYVEIAEMLRLAAQQSTTSESNELIPGK